MRNHPPCYIVTETGSILLHKKMYNFAEHKGPIPLEVGEGYDFHRC